MVKNSGKPETVHWYWSVPKIYRTAGQTGTAFDTVLTSLIETLKRMFSKKPNKEDWRSEMKREMGKLEHRGSIKELKDYILIEGE